MRTAKEVAAARKKPPNKHKPRPRTGDPILAENLFWLRVGHNLSNDEIAAKTGVSAAYIWQLETGRSMPSVGILARLAAFYDVTLDALAGHLVEAAKNGDSA